MLLRRATMWNGEDAEHLRANMTFAFVASRTLPRAHHDTLDISVVRNDLLNVPACLLHNTRNIMRLSHTDFEKKTAVDRHYGCSSRCQLAISLQSISAAVQG